MDSTGREYDDWATYNGDEKMNTTTQAIHSAVRLCHTGIVDPPPMGVHPDRWLAMINSIVLNGGVV